MESKLKIVIVEPSVIIARGLREIVSEGLDCTVSSFTDLHQCLDRFPVLDPDLVLLNPSVADNGRRQSPRSLYAQLEGVTLVGFPTAPVSEDITKYYDDVINLFDEPGTVIRKLRAALSKDTPEAEQSDDLSEREKEILVAVAQGLTNKEIADRHNISVHTVISHRKNISRKTGIKTVSGLTIYAMLKGLIDLADL